MRISAFAFPGVLALLALGLTACRSNDDTRESREWGAPPDSFRPDRTGPQASPTATPDATPAPTPDATPWPEPTPIGTLELVRTLPHAGWTEGLDFHDGKLWESRPTDIIEVLDPKDGRLLWTVPTPSGYNESIAWRAGKLWHVSNADANLYIGAPAVDGFDWSIAGTVPEEHAWGITHDPSHVIVTGFGSPFLYFLDPDDASLVRALETEVDDLEDLAWDRGAIWASSFKEHAGMFFRLNPWNGAIVDLHTVPAPADCPIVDGLAVDPVARELYVTGKRCPGIWVFALP